MSEDRWNIEFPAAFVALLAQGHVTFIREGDEEGTIEVLGTDGNNAVVLKGPGHCKPSPARIVLCERIVKACEAPPTIAMALEGSRFQVEGPDWAQPHRVHILGRRMGLEALCLVSGVTPHPDPSLEDAVLHSGDIEVYEDGWPDIGKKDQLPEGVESLRGAIPPSSAQLLAQLALMAGQPLVRTTEYSTWDRWDPINSDLGYALVSHVKPEFWKARAPEQVAS